MRELWIMCVAVLGTTGCLEHESPDAGGNPEDAGVRDAGARDSGPGDAGSPSCAPVGPACAFQIADGSGPEVWAAIGGALSASAGPTDTAHARVALDSLDRPFVAWIEAHAVRAARWDGAAWLALPSLSGGESTTQNALFEAVAFDAEDRPIVAFVDASGEDGAYATYVRRWSGSAWEALGGHASGRIGERTYLTAIPALARVGTALFVALASTPHPDRSTSHMDVIEVHDGAQMRLEGFLGDGLAAANPRLFLEVDTACRLAIAYAQQGTSQGDFPALGRYDATARAWRRFGPPVPPPPPEVMAAGNPDSTQMVLSGDVPLLSRSIPSETEFRTGILRLTPLDVWEWWAYLTIDPDEGWFLNDRPRFVLDRTGAPVLALGLFSLADDTQGPLRVARFDGAAWSTSTVSHTAAARGFDLVDVVFDSQGAAVIAYSEVVGGSIDVVVKRHVQSGCL
jgi:hypothetical protein